MARRKKIKRQHIHKKKVAMQLKYHFTTYKLITQCKLKINPQPKKETEKEKKTGKVRDTEKEKKTHSKEKLVI